MLHIDKAEMTCYNPTHKNCPLWGSRQFTSKSVMQIMLVWKKTKSF